MSARQTAFTDERRRAAFGALASKQPGSIEWSWHVLEVLKLRWQRVEGNHEEFSKLLAEAEAQHIWDVVPPEHPYGSKAAMLKAELGVDEDTVNLKVRAAQRSQEAACKTTKETAPERQGQRTDLTKLVEARS